jgi:hypothetical protein
MLVEVDTRVSLSEGFERLKAVTCYGDRMIRRSFRGLALALVILAAGCGGDDETPTTPDPVSVTETFAGTLSPNDAESHPFSSQRGTVTATLTNVSPDNTLTVGFSLGTWNGLSCAVVLANDKAVQGTSLIGSVNGTGNLCVRMYDVGTVTQPVTYEVNVVHF